MAKVTQRIWKRGRVKRVAWGFSYQEKATGKQIRTFKEAWSGEDAETAMAKALLGLEVPKLVERPTMTFGQAVERYLATKESEGNHP